MTSHSPQRNRLSQTGFPTRRLPSATTKPWRRVRTSSWRRKRQHRQRRLLIGQWIRRPTLMGWGRRGRQGRRIPANGKRRQMQWWPRSASTSDPQDFVKSWRWPQMLSLNP